MASAQVLGSNAGSQASNPTDLRQWNREQLDILGVTISLVLDIFNGFVSIHSAALTSVLDFLTP